MTQCRRPGRTQLEQGERVVLIEITDAAGTKPIAFLLSIRCVYVRSNLYLLSEWEEDRESTAWIRCVSLLETMPLATMRVELLGSVRARLHASRKRGRMSDRHEIRQRCTWHCRLLREKERLYSLEEFRSLFLFLIRFSLSG